jgi:hypothetical protein
MLAGGVVSLTSALEWSVVLGCVISLALMIVRIARQPPLRPVEPAVAVGRPVIYESTLRR